MAGRRKPGKRKAVGVLRRKNRARDKDLSGARVNLRSQKSANIIIREYEGSVAIIPIKSIVEAQCHPKTIKAGSFGARKAVSVIRFIIGTNDGGFWMLDVFPSDKELVIAKLAEVIR